MIKETITNLETKIQHNDMLDKRAKEELLDLLSALQTEISDLSQTNMECAESIAGFAQTSTHEAIRKDKNEQLVSLSLDGFASSVNELETSHPRLVEVVNRISSLLSNMGI